MAFAAVGVAQHLCGTFFGDRRGSRDLGLDDGRLVALGPVAFWPVVAARRTGLVAADALFAAVAVAVVPLAPAITAAALAGLTALVGLTGLVGLAALGALAIAITVAIVAVAVVEARAVVALPVARTIITRTIIALPVVPRPIITLPIITAPVVTRTLVLPAVVARLAVGFGDSAAAGAFRRRGCFVSGFGLRLGAFVLEVDVVAGGELVAAEDLGRRPLRLEGAQQAEVMFGVLQVVLGQHPVAGGRRVPRQLLVLFENRLGVAADLHAVRTVRIEGPVGVLLLRLAAASAAAAAATAAATAAALTLHALEISHYAMTVWLFLGRTSARSLR